MKRRATESFARERALVELGHHRAAERDVGEADPRHAHERLEEQLAQPREPIADDHRGAEQRGLERRGAGGHEQQVGRAHHRVGAAGDDAERRHALVAQLRGIDGGRPRHQEPRVGMGGDDPAGGRAHRRQHAGHLVAAAPGQQPHHRRVAVDAELLARVGARRRRGEGVEHRMTDERHRHARTAIERGLERKHGQHERDHPPDEPHAPGPPRPHLGRDEIRDGHAGAARGARQSQVELGEIDDDQRVGAVGACHGRPQPPVGAVEPRHAADCLGAAHGGGGRHVDEQLHAFGGHAAAAHAVEPGAGRGRAERAGQRRPVQVAGGLAGDEHDGARPLRRRRHAC